LIDPETGMLRAAKISQSVIDLFLVDQERIFAFATRLGDSRTLSAVEEDADAVAAGWTATGLPLFGRIGVNRYPATQWFRKTAVRVLPGFGVA
jgi:hypothetical protein